jgi:hypothetical protein
MPYLSKRNTSKLLTRVDGKPHAGPEDHEEPLPPRRSSRPQKQPSNEDNTVATIKRHSHESGAEVISPSSKENSPEISRASLPVVPTKKRKKQHLDETTEANDVLPKKQKSDDERVEKIPFESKKYKPSQKKYPKKYSNIHALVSNKKSRPSKSLAKKETGKPLEPVSLKHTNSTGRQHERIQRPERRTSFKRPDTQTKLSVPWNCS